MTDKFVVKDSGVREEYASGMRRDTQEGKVNYRLIPVWFLKRLAEHLTKGAIKYGKHNWTLANSAEELARFEESGERHFMQWLDGETDEDHAMATVFNIMAAEHVKTKMSEPTVSFLDDPKAFLERGLKKSQPDKEDIQTVFLKNGLVMYLTTAEINVMPKWMIEQEIRYIIHGRHAAYYCEDNDWKSIG